MEITQPMTVADAASALDQMMLPLDGEQQKTDKARLTEDNSEVAVSVDEELDVQDRRRRKAHRGLHRQS